MPLAPGRGVREVVPASALREADDAAPPGTEFSVERGPGPAGVEGAEVDAARGAGAGLRREGVAPRAEQQPGGAAPAAPEGDGVLGEGVAGAADGKQREPGGGAVGDQSPTCGSPPTARARTGVGGRAGPRSGSAAGVRAGSGPGRGRGRGRRARSRAGRRGPPTSRGGPRGVRVRWVRGPSRRGRGRGRRRSPRPGLGRRDRGRRRGRSTRRTRPRRRPRGRRSTAGRVSSPAWPRRPRPRGRGTGATPPSSRRRPRTSCATAAKPRSAQPRSSARWARRSYGVRISTAGWGPGVAGRWRSVARVVPSGVVRRVVAGVMPGRSPLRAAGPPAVRAVRGVR